MLKGCRILVDSLVPKWRTVALALTGMTLITSGCYWPRPHDYVDDPGDQSISRRAWAHDHTLIIEVHQTPGMNIAAFDKWVVDGALYLAPRAISSGGGGTTKFEIDVSKYHLREPWTENIYWHRSGRVGYPIGNPGFWSSASRVPFTRTRIALVNTL